MHFLFVDDMPVRQKAFQQFLLGTGNTADYAIDYESAIDLLGTTYYDILFLDHDLSEEDIMCVPGLTNIGKTGTDLACWIVQTMTGSPLRPKFIILHSLNPVGSENMANVLSRSFFKCYRIPFHNLGDMINRMTATPVAEVHH